MSVSGRGRERDGSIKIFCGGRVGSSGGQSGQCTSNCVIMEPTLIWLSANLIYTGCHNTALTRHLAVTLEIIESLRLDIESLRFYNSALLKYFWLRQELKKFKCPSVWLKVQITRLLSQLSHNSLSYFVRQTKPSY